MNPRNPLLTDLEARLQRYGVGPIHKSRMQDQPDTVLMLTDYTSDPSKDITRDGLPVLQAFNVQVMARAARTEGVSAAEDLAWDAMRALVGRHLLLPDPITGPRRYDWIRATALPYHIGFDERDRPIVTFNLEIQRWGDVTPPTPAS